MNRNEIETQLIERVGTDPAFRQHLLDDPKAAIAQTLGVALPPGMKITVLEEAPGQHYLILPPALPSLDELDLALVGGGRTLRPGAVPSAPAVQINPRQAKRASNASC